MKPIGLIFGGLVTAYMGIAALNPILAPLVRELGLSEIQGGLIITTAALMWSLMSPFWGQRSEVVGRKPVFVTGLFGFAAGFTLFGSVAYLGLAGIVPPLVAFALMMASRGVVGAFFSAVPVSAQAYIADTTTGSERTAGMALIGAANSVGLIIGPALGGALAVFGLLTPIYIAAVLPLMAALVVLWRLPRASERRVAVAHPRLSPLDPRYWPLLIIGFQIIMAFVSMQVTAGFYFQDLLDLTPQATARLLGITLVVAGVGSLAAQLGIIRVLRPTPRMLLCYGLPVAAIGFVCLILAFNFLTLMLAYVLTSFGLALSLPGYIAAVTLTVGQDEQGSLAGLTASAQGFGAVVGPVLATSLYEIRPEIPYIFSALLLASVALVVWVHPRMRRIGQEAVVGQV